jgi:hypothetical protein
MIPKLKIYNLGPDGTSELIAVIYRVFKPRVSAKRLPFPVSQLELRTSSSRF